MEIDQNVLILTMMNLDKLISINQELKINKYNCYKIFFVCLIETNKLYDDFIVPRKALCNAGLINSNEFLFIESEFLEKIKYNLYNEERDFFEYKKKLSNLYEVKYKNLKKKYDKNKEIDYMNARFSYYNDFSNKLDLDFRKNNIYDV